MTNKEFAEKNAGKYFRYGGMKVQVVGYCAHDGHSVLVSMGANKCGFSWGAQVLDDDDVFVIRSKASNYWYVEQCQLSV